MRLSLSKKQIKACVEKAYVKIMSNSDANKYSVARGVLLEYLNNEREWCPEVQDAMDMLKEKERNDAKQ